MLKNYSIIGSPLVLSSDTEVLEAERALGIQFPSGYREYVTTLGEGVLGGTYIRIYPPRRILTGLNNNKEWRERIRDYWFWDGGQSVMTKETALQCIIIGDTTDGDELIVHPNNSERIFVLPRHSEDVIIAGDGLFAAIEWLCTSGLLSESFSERNFEPFDSRK